MLLQYTNMLLIDPFAIHVINNKTQFHLNELGEGLEECSNIEIYLLYFLIFFIIYFILVFQVFRHISY